MMKERPLPADLEKEVNAKVVAIIGERRGRGYCHAFWREKKRILKKEYGIDWKTPKELNPGAMFD